MPESIPTGAIERMRLVQVDQADSASDFRHFSRLRYGNDRSGHFADFRAPRYARFGDHAGPFDGACRGFDVVYDQSFTSRRYFAASSGGVGLI